MRPLPNWRAVLRRAWSVRLWVLAIVLTVAETVFWFIGQSLTGQGVFLVVLCGLQIGGLVARFVAQKGVSDGD